MNEIGYWNEVANCVRKSWSSEIDQDTVDRFKAIPYNDRFKAYQEIDSIIHKMSVDNYREARLDGRIGEFDPSTVGFLIPEDRRPNRMFQVIFETAREYMKNLNIDQFLAPYETVK